MIYFVSRQSELFDEVEYTMMSIEDSLSMLNTWEMFQFDTETSGRDAHINTVLLMQFGDIKGESSRCYYYRPLDIQRLYRKSFYGRSKFKV